MLGLVIHFYGVFYCAAASWLKMCICRGPVHFGAVSPSSGQYSPTMHSPVASVAPSTVNWQLNGESLTKKHFNNFRC